jgi:type II secretory pathway component PulC
MSFHLAKRTYLRMRLNGLFIFFFFIFFFFYYNTMHHVLTHFSRNRAKAFGKQNVTLFLSNEIF